MTDNNNDQHDSVFSQPTDNADDTDSYSTDTAPSTTTLTSTTVPSPWPEDAGQPWHTITSDHMVWKRIITPTTHPTPQLCQPLNRITMTITGRYADGTTFIDSHNDERDLILGHATQAKGVEIGLATMYVGEHARFFMNTEYGWSNPVKNRPNAIQPADREMYYDITVIRQEHEQSVSKMTLQDKLQYIEQRRELGKQLYNTQKYESAMRQYERALQVIHQGLDTRSHVNVQAASGQHTSKPTVAQQYDVQQSECTCYVNQAQCLYKLTRYADCLEALNKALKIKPNHVKALYRRALCHKQRDDNELMLTDLRRVTHLAKNDAALMTTVYTMIVAAERQQTANERVLAQQYAGMFDRAAVKKQGLGLYDDDKAAQGLTVMQRVQRVFTTVADMFRQMCRRDYKSKVA